MLTARLRGTAAALGDLQRRIDRSLERAFEREGTRVADEAKQTHPFQNHSEALERSIGPVDPTGRASDGTLAGGAEATAPYASYVNDRPEFEFLSLAFLLSADEFERDVDDALADAARAAGM